MEEVGAVRAPYAVTELTDALRRLDADRAVPVIVASPGAAAPVGSAAGLR